MTEHESGLNEHDLQIAATIQESLLPHTCPHCPHGHIAAGHRMQGQVGGDFYDFPFPGEGKAGLLIGDVMGHGVSAALLMAMIVGLLRRDARTNADPLAAARLVNDHLEQIEGEVGHVVLCSMFYGVIDIAGRTLEYVNAGHPAPIVCNKKSCLISGLDATCPVLGAVDSSRVEKACHTFDDVERIVLYTDGITEAVRADGERFGRLRLHRVASEYVDLTPEQLVQATFDEVDRFADGQARDDDQSLVVVDFGGDEERRGE